MAAPKIETVALDWSKLEAHERVRNAAPDLLSVAHAALSYVVAHGVLREGTEAYNLQRSLRAAIKKAEGR